jgi:hypothetical protein
MIKMIKTMNQYDKVSITKCIEAIVTRALSATAAFTAQDEVTLELNLRIMTEKIDEIRNILFTV